MPFINNAQVRVFDAGLTKALIEQNRDEHGKATEKMEEHLEEAPVTALYKTRYEKFKEQHKKTKERLNSLFALASDVDIVINAVKDLDEIYETNKRIMILAADYPLLIPIVLDYTSTVYNQGKRMGNYFLLIVATYTTVNNMEPLHRLQIYRQISTRMSLLLSSAQSLEKRLIRYSQMNIFLVYFKNTIWDVMYQRDKQIVNRIITNIQNF